MEKVAAPKGKRIKEPATNGDAVKYDKPKQEDDRIKTVNVEVPLDMGAVTAPYIRELHISNLTRQENETLRRLFQALRSHNVELAPFKPVASKADSVRWLIRQLIS